MDLKLFEVEQDLGKSIPQIRSTWGTVIVPGCHVEGQQCVTNDGSDATSCDDDSGEEIDEVLEPGPTLYILAEPFPAQLPPKPVTVFHHVSASEVNYTLKLPTRSYKLRLMGKMARSWKRYLPQ